MATSSGTGLRNSVLVVEDELLIAMEIADYVSDLGYRPLGPCASIGQARSLMTAVLPDAATLDVNLGDEVVTPLAELLIANGIPFVLVTGNSRSSLDSASLRQAPYVAKPVKKAELAVALQQVLGSE